MRRAIVILIGCCHLVACDGGLTAEAPLFNPEEAVAILGDRGDLTSDAGALRSRFQRVATGYDVDLSSLPDVATLGGQVTSVRVHLFPIAETAEDDYVAQIAIPGRSTFTYVFILRTSTTSLATWANPDLVQTNAGGEHCRLQGEQGNECEFVSRDSLIAYYRHFAREQLAEFGRNPGPDTWAITVAPEDGQAR